MKTNHYRACDDNDLHPLLETLHRYSIHPLYVETGGEILIKISDANDLDITTYAHLDESGIWLRHGQDLNHGLQIDAQTLWQLATMSACFKAGYCKHRQETEEKDRKEQK